MSVAPLRPRFQTFVPCHPQKAFEKFRLRLQQPDCAFEGTVLDTFISVTVKASARHYWSPVLTVQSESVHGGTRLRGHYGPHPNVWTLLLAVAAAILFSGIFVLMYACAQLLLGQAPWGLLAVPLTLILLGALYGIALLGQWRAHDQMLQLKSFFDVSVCAQELAAIGEGQMPSPVSPEEACASCQKLCARV